MPESRGDGNAGALLARADDARDAGRWGEAAEAYGAYLRLRPEDRGILVQRGHCLKEDGDPAGALDLYRRAEAMQPDDVDIHLQIGHALKLLGRREAAAEAYGRALLLDPQDAAAQAEWRAALSQVPASRGEGPVLDLSDLVSWFFHRRAPSGIQRVQAEIAAALADQVSLCAMHPEEDGWRVLPTPLFRRLYHLSRSGADAKDPVWLDTLGVLEGWRRAGPPLRPGPGTLILMTGSAWWLPRYATALRAARAAGARHVPLLHDCGPLVLPDLAGPALRAEFGRWFSALPVLADGVLAVSHATAAEYRRLMARHLPDWAAPPVLVVTPDGRDPAVPEPEEAPAAGPPGRRLPRLPVLREMPRSSVQRVAAHPALPEGPFILLVSSLEPRKNHLLALTTWRILLDRRGAAGTPRLVFAGRRAPGDGRILEALADDPALAERVTLLHDLDDAALARLYRGCLFTIYPSRHEGWGLPVSESLLHRRVPVVSEIPSLMESGRNGAVFFTPGSAEDLAATVEGLIADPARLAAAAARIPRHGGLRPWAEVAEEMLASARRLAREPQDPPPPLPLSGIVRLGHGGSPGPSSALARAAQLPEGAGWLPPEEWGAWTRPGRAALALIAPFEGPARVTVALRPPPGVKGAVRLTFGRKGASATIVERRAEAAGEVALEIGPGEPELRLVLEASPGGELEDGTRVGIGIVSVAVMRAGEVRDRVAYLENRLLVPAQPL
ncbi:tetratricopeptide repeat-containing glycosyltransferase family protein [Roseomonas populi]|uniref:Tetratricopeptide repeat-containing glycosyltransferase family protein n=1 Tax=Roseomonas populi TaxID=3121582 RepID=A0ABT1X4C0_9PROT|nr:tetratricopeptide repeat-containing glycosyltransferase family protein [Roseomonas pecuniae]MCR0982950.1 tetratricopeptide repeat-containing glycosyltransferase family protein [Roseomonas pecuniae]